jgi:methenyltetrahydrofolate cyclohydrolase
VSGQDDALPVGGGEAYLEMPLGGFLSAVAGGEAAPGAGSAAAVAVAVGACLCAMAARLSERQLTEDRARKLITEAERLRAAANLLIEADADSFEPVLAARRLPAGTAASAEFRQHRIAVALSDAAMVPMQVVELAAQVARLAAAIVADGNQNLRGEAITALLLAEAGVGAAATLVGINLAHAPDDARPARAAQVRTEVADSVRAVLCAVATTPAAGPPGAAENAGPGR